MDSFHRNVTVGEILDECNKHFYCDTSCSYYGDVKNKCLIFNYPCDWDLDDYTPNYDLGRHEAEKEEDC